MNVQLNNLENSRVEFIIRVDKKEFVEAIQKAFKQNISKYNVPGFRKGKAPFQIFKQMFGVSVLYNDAANFVIDRTYREAIEEHKVEVVDYPNIDIITCSENEDFEYKATVYVKPEIRLGDYKGLDIEEVKYEVSEDDIERELQNLREKNSRLISKESGIIEEGDTAIIDFKGYINGEPFNGGEAKNYSLVIGSKSFIDNFEDQLVGKAKGDNLEINVVFPENYGVDELKGKEAKFDVIVNEVQVKELPELNDSFAKDHSEFNTIAELRDSVRDRLAESNENKQKFEFENSVIEAVCGNVDVSIPEPMIQGEIDRLIQDFENKIRYQGVSLDQYCNYYGISLEDIRSNFKERAEKQVLSNLVLEEISKKENIIADEEEISDKALELAKMYSQDDEKINSIVDNLLKSYKESIIKDIILSKTVKFLVNENRKSDSK